MDGSASGFQHQGPRRGRSHRVRKFRRLLPVTPEIARNNLHGNHTHQCVADGQFPGGCWATKLKAEPLELGRTEHMRKERYSLFILPSCGGKPRFGYLDVPGRLTSYRSRESVTPTILVHVYLSSLSFRGPSLSMDLPWPILTRSAAGGQGTTPNRSESVYAVNARDP